MRKKEEPSKALAEWGTLDVVGGEIEPPFNVSHVAFEGLTGQGHP